MFNLTSGCWRTRLRSGTPQSQALCRKVPELMENETIAIALITAGSGVLGALLGAAGAVVGPWWVKRSEIVAAKKQREAESRRKAVVDFANKKLISMRAYHQVFSLGVKDEYLLDKIENANISANELYSLISKEDSALKDWINKMSFKAFAIKPKSAQELMKIDAFLRVGVQYIIAWHVGELSASEFKPFGLNSNLEPVWLDDWDSEWPK